MFKRTAFAPVSARIWTATLSPDQRTDGDDKVKDVVEDDAKRRLKLLKLGKLWARHDRVGHRLDDELRGIRVRVDVVHADKGLQEADDDEQQQREEDQGFLHHDLDDDQHDAEEAEGVEVEQQSAPEQGRAEGEEVVAQMVVPGPLVRAAVARSRQGQNAEDEGRRQEGVEGQVEDVPEGDVVAADLPQLDELVQDEAQGEDVEDALDDVNVAGLVDRVDDLRVEDQEQDREEGLDGILILRHPHAIGVEVIPVVRARALVVVNEAGRIEVVLDEPAAPEVDDALLVSRRADDAERMGVHGTFDDVGTRRLVSVSHVRKASKQDLALEVVLVFFRLDAVSGQARSVARGRRPKRASEHADSQVLGQHLRRRRSGHMQLRVIQLQPIRPSACQPRRQERAGIRIRRLLLEPLLTDHQTENDACSIVLAGSGLGRLLDLRRDDGTVGTRDHGLVQLVRDDLFDEVLESQSDLGNLLRRDGRAGLIIMDGQDWGRYAVSRSPIVLSPADETPAAYDVDAPEYGSREGFRDRGAVSTEPLSLACRRAEMYQLSAARRSTVLTARTTKPDGQLPWTGTCSLMGGRQSSGSSSGPRTTSGLCNQELGRAQQAGGVSLA